MRYNKITIRFKLDGFLASKPKLTFSYVTKAKKKKNVSEYVTDLLHTSLNASKRNTI